MLTRSAVAAGKPPNKIRRLSFFKKFFELQLAMLQHNAGLTDSHPYASGPINWPFLLSGISFWTGTNENREQIYLIGNIVGWWLCMGAVSMFVGILVAEQLARRRGSHPIPEGESFVSRLPPSLSPRRQPSSSPRIVDVATVMDVANVSTS